MLEERKEFLSIAAHDLKAPASATCGRNKHCFIRHQKARLFRAFENIILKATEHTPPEGSLTIDAEYTGQQAVITFTDTSEGISSDDLPHIFDYKFSTKNSPGTRGLGFHHKLSSHSL